VAAIFPEHFQRFTVLLKNNIFIVFFLRKTISAFCQNRNKTNSRIRAKMNQQEGAGAGAVSGPCAGRPMIEIKSFWKSTVAEV
jgi:hypothetical protein